MKKPIAVRFISTANVRAVKTDKIRNAKIGFIFQNYYLEKGYTIAEILRNQMIIAGSRTKRKSPVAPKKR